MDADDDALAYTLSGADAVAFALDPGSGQLRTSAPLDYEATPAYVVTVEADDDNGGRASIAVTIDVGNVADAPSPPADVVATPAATSVALAWAAVPGAARYWVEHRATATPPEPWTTASGADMLTGPTHTVMALACETAYEFQVRAYGDGVAHTAAWGEPSMVVAAATVGGCPPVFDAPPYEFSVREDAAIDDAVGNRNITATDPGSGAVSYAIADGDDDGVFAIHPTTGALTVAGALDYLTTATYTLTVMAMGATDAADVLVAITVTGVDCADGMVIADPLNHQALVLDCRVLLGAQEVLEGADAGELQGGGTLNWGDPLALAQWEGVTSGGTPSRITGLDLSNKLLGGAIPAELSGLVALTTLDLRDNNLTGAIPGELSVLTNLTTLGLSGNDLSGCLPNALRPLAMAITAAGGVHDLAQLPQSYCDATPPPAPTDLEAAAASVTSITLTWVGAPDVGPLTYRVEYRVADSGAAWTEDANDLSAASHVVDDLACGTAYEVQVSASGDGVTRAAAWGPAAALVASTAVCPPAFDATGYSFTVTATADVDAVVGTVTATTEGPGALRYAIAAGNPGGTFALDEETGDLTVAGALDAASYTLTVSATEAGGGTATVEVAIAVTPVAVSFGAATYTAAEGGSVTVTVTLSADPERTVTIPLTPTEQGGATSADYAGVPPSVAFASGETEQTFDVAATADTEDDDGESVRLGFGPLPTGVSAGPTTESVVSITDDDVPEVTVSFGAATYTAAEGGSVTVMVTLSADPERPVTIPLTPTEQGGATSADYAGVPPSVTFASGETEQTFDVSATQDTDDDDGESVTLGFGALPTGVSAGATAESVVSITDALPEVTVSFGAATYTVDEGSSVTVTVTLSVDPERAVTIPVTATDQDGASSADYAGVPPSVTFASGETEQTFDVAATQDTEDDDGERVTLGFGPLPTGVSAGATTESVVSLTDDDVPEVTVRFGAATYTATEGAASGVTVTVTLSADPERAVTIPLTPTYGGGADAADVSGIPATVTFSAGTTSATFTVVAADDAVEDGGESVTLGFGPLPVRVTAGAPATATVSLEDNDEPTVTTVWSATLTVGLIYGAFPGYGNAESGNAGALSDDAFDWAGATYTVESLFYFGPNLNLYLSAEEAGSLTALTLQVGEVALAVADAEVLSGPVLLWVGITFDWEVGETVTVTLTAPGQ